MSRAMSGGAGFHDISYRRTDQDRRPPRQVLTAVLLGDPLPDRLDRAEALRAKLLPPRAELRVAMGEAE